MQESNTATTTRAGGLSRQDPMMDRTTGMRVSCVIHFLSLPFYPSSFRFSVCSCTAKAFSPGGLSPILFSSFQAPDTLCTLPSWPCLIRSPGLHLELLRDMSWRTRFQLISNSSSPTCSLGLISTSMLYRSLIRRVGVFEPCVTWSS